VFSDGPDGLPGEGGSVEVAEDSGQPGWSEVVEEGDVGSPPAE
jgi:hypothetical protein